jgi:hypothetical protein
MIQTHENAVCTHDLEVTSPTPLVARPAAYEVGQSDPGQPAAPEIGNEPARTATAPRAPEVGGESAFGQNAQPERGDAIVEYKPSASNLPQTISAREIANDAAAYYDGRCGNVGPGAR